MTDYRNTKLGDRWAHKHRWFVWLFVPAIFLLGFLYTYRNELVFLLYTNLWRFYQ